MAVVASAILYVCIFHVHMLCNNRKIHIVIKVFPFSIKSLEA